MVGYGEWLVADIWLVSGEHVVGIWWMDILWIFDAYLVGIWWLVDIWWASGGRLWCASGGHMVCIWLFSA